MRSRGFVIGVMAFGAVLLAGCQIKTPAPVQPKLEEVILRGTRICGVPFTNGWGTFTYACDALPTVSATAWQLTPKYALDVRGVELPNRTVNVVLTTPSLTGLEIAHIPNPRERRIVEQAGADVRDAQLGHANDNGRAVVTVSDDGTVKTWRIRMQIHPCARKAEFEFVNLAGDGSGRSAPIKFTVLRADDDSVCADGFGPMGGGYGVGLPTSTGGPTTGTTMPMGPCPGGGQPTIFKLCEKANNQPREIASYTEYSACSFAEIETVFGYKDAAGRPTEKAQKWRLSQVSGPEACRGTP